ncbi:MAG: replicative DNA helicase [Ruminococcaceae bacterium]|nr:replicative DNA helicase [Oscillospiraceae bacterium]
MAEKLNYLPDSGNINAPYSIDAEQAVLGAIIIDPDCLNLVATQIKEEYFYLKEHREIYKTLRGMLEMGGKAIDFISLLEQLKRNGVYDEAGGKAYLTKLAQVVPTSKNIATYVDLVKDRYYARALLGAAETIITNVNENLLDPALLLDHAEQAIYDIRQGRDVSGLVHIGKVIEEETYARLTKITDPETAEDFKGIPTGISALDRVITGLNKSDLIILGARPGMGKTSFALNIARHAAVNAKKTVCFFSLEMTRDQLAQRMLSNEASIESEKLRTGELSTDEWTRLAQAGTNLASAQIYFDETSGITVPEMKAKLRRMPKVDLVVVDYLGLMQSAKKTENRVQEVSEITRNLKGMAKELNVPVLACAQLSRGTEARGKSHRPALADLRESGSIEQDADIVMFIYRENYYKSETDENTNPENMPDPNKAEIIVAKNRHGSVDTVELHWDGKYTRFASQEVFR